MKIKIKLASIRGKCRYVIVMKLERNGTVTCLLHPRKNERCEDGKWCQILCIQRVWGDLKFVSCVISHVCLESMPCYIFIKISNVDQISVVSTLATKSITKECSRSFMLTFPRQYIRYYDSITMPTKGNICITFFFFFFFNEWEQNRHITLFLESASLKKRKRKSMSSDNKTAKISKNWNSRRKNFKNHAIWSLRWW